MDSLAASELGDCATDLLEVRTDVWVLVPAGLDEVDDLPAQLAGLGQHRAERDALPVTHAVHHVCTGDGLFVGLLNLLLPLLFLGIYRVIKIESVYYIDARFFRSSATQNAPPAGGQPAGGAFCGADKQKNCASKVNKLIFGCICTANFQETAQEVNV